MAKTNEEKAREIANNCSTEIVGAEVSDETYITTEQDCYNAALAMAEWKDVRIKELEETLERRSKYEREYLDEALKAYGNAIVPQVMYEIFRAIEETYEIRK